ncbi:hypothetical protein RISK_005437 [Rhodopirellula islandica]|uniref:Uncharacterized protein n=1 Tax=Rhodopirellula islandica TaxID=595434 RepID=A0A0J1B7C1_RHOIS|nr:hypothetical protein [Rhodopirellula islandica]KLU02371.1 hypothetical protein RISK_005437 [Rhodopirellula islandica]
MLNTPIRRVFSRNLPATNPLTPGRNVVLGPFGRAVLLFLGLVVLTASSAWAQLPPPVQLPLQSGETIVSSSTYVNGVPSNEPGIPSAGMEDYWSGSLEIGAPAQVPHVIIQAPGQRNVRHPSSAGNHHPNAALGQPAGGVSHQQNSGQLHPHWQHAHQKAAAAVAPLTHPPGVENDPGAKGPGRLGLGEHWVKNPQARPAIPAATVQPRWKTPYSYGYFGAEGKRHWSRQHGYNDRSLQWSLR